MLVGVAGELMHYVPRGTTSDTNSGRYPNVFLQVFPQVGFHSGFLKLVVRTRNGCGISTGSELLLDYGSSYNLELPLGITPAAAAGTSASTAVDSTGPEHPFPVELLQGKVPELICTSATVDLWKLIGSSDTNSSVYITKPRSCTTDVRLPTNSILLSSGVGRILSLEQWRRETNSAATDPVTGAIPISLRSNTLILYQGEVIAFEAGWKKVLASTSGNVTMYSMVSCNISTPNSSERLVVSLKTPLVFVPKEGTPLEKILFCNPSKNATLLFTWGVNSSSRFHPSGVSLVTTRSLNLQDPVQIE